MNSSCFDSGGCPSVQIVQSAAKTFLTRLFYAKTGEPFNLTGATEIIALFPGLNNTPVKKTLSNSGGITVVGSPGAGKIQIALSTTDTQAMQSNPQINQNLQITATIAGVAQQDTLSFGSPPQAGVTYSVTLNGVTFSYLVKAGDTAQVVFGVLASLINRSGVGITAEVSGSDDSATMSLTADVAGLGFTNVVSAGITLTNTTANGGVRSIFLLQQMLSIQPQDYSGS